MTDDNAGGWPNKPGVPLNPERDGWHWIAGPETPVAIVWHANTQNWVLGALGLPPAMFITATYLAPCLTPSEVTAREAAAWAAGAAAMRAACVAEYDENRHSHWDVFGTALVAIRALPLPPMPTPTQGGSDAE